MHRRNGKIRAREVRVLDENKAQLGVMSLNDALKLAMTKGLDLVEIAPNATPAVCRIVDYGKFMYEEAKRAKDGAALDGIRAHQMHLVRSAAEQQLSPERRARRDRFELQLAELRGRKAKLPEGKYLAEQEKLLLELAALYEGT